MTLTLLILVILIALIFEYINGLHDSPNIISTIASTKALSPKFALAYGTIFCFVGAFFETYVANTIARGIVDVNSVTLTVIACALFSAIIWNLTTWHYGIPSSSSHALIGGLLGASLVHSGINSIHTAIVLNKILIPMITSPLLGLGLSFILVIIIFNWFSYKINKDKLNPYLKKLQLLFSGLLAFGHGSNSAQKTMGIITLALFSTGFISKFHIPLWVVFVCALVMSLGTLLGGQKILNTMGNKIVKIKPIHGLAAEVSSSSIIIGASHLGVPISTTQVVSSSIIGAGTTFRKSTIKWDLIKNMVIAWFITIPTCLIISAIICFIAIKLEHPMLQVFRFL